MVGSCLAVAPLEEKWIVLYWCWCPRQQETSSYNQILQTHLTHCHLHGMENISICLPLNFITHPETRHPIAGVPRDTLHSQCLPNACKRQQVLHKAQHSGSHEYKNMANGGEEGRDKVMYWSSAYGTGRAKQCRVPQMFFIRYQSETSSQLLHINIMKFLFPQR